MTVGKRWRREMVLPDGFVADPPGGDAMDAQKAFVNRLRR